MTKLDSTMSELELFIQYFVQKERRERYLALAAKPSRRRDFVWELAHDGRHLERSKMRRLSPSEATLAAISKELKALGASKTCLVIAATHFEGDGQTVDTASALAAVVGRGQDVILFFAPALVAYYENHEGQQYILQAKP